MFGRWGNPHLGTITPRWRGTKKGEQSFLPKKKEIIRMILLTKSDLFFIFLPEFFLVFLILDRVKVPIPRTMKFGNEGHIFYRGPQVKFFVVTSGM